MTFVYPLLLGGLLLAGLPVLLHFLVRKKPRTLLFPAYRFLLQKKRSNTRNLRLRNLLLLLMRMALLALLCVALSRPRLFHESIGLSRERPVAMVLIFDTTPSMEYKSNDLTRLDLAKKRALELLDQLPEDCRLMVLDAGDPDGFAREDWHKSLEKARQRIQSLTIRSESVPVTKAIDEAQRRYESWDDPEAQRIPKFVCVFSDRTKPSWQVDPAFKRGDQVQVLYFDVGIDAPTDLGIVQAELGGDRQSYRQGEKIPLSVVITSTAKMNSTLIVEFDRKVLKQPFHVDADKPETLAFEIDTRDLKPGFHQAEVRFETRDDALPHNDRRFVTFKVLEKPRVLVLADDLTRTRKFAFALELLHYAVDHRKVDDKVNLGSYEAAFLVGVAAPSEKLWRELAVQVSEGRSVAVIPPGEELVRIAYNNEEAQKVLPARLGQEVKSDGVAWNTWNDDQLRHPLLAPLRKWLGDEVSYDFIQAPRRAMRYWKVEKDGARVVVAYDDRHADPAIVERPASKQSGKVLLLTTPLDDRKESWNNYDENVTAFYLAVTMMCARHLCAEPESMKLNYHFVPPPPSVKMSSPAFARYVLSTGDSSEEIRFDANGRWAAERLVKPGNYLVEGSNPLVAQTEVIAKFSVNIVGAECDLTRWSVTDIESVLGENSVVPQDRRRSIVDTLTWDEPMELFPWLLIALLFLLAFENLLANRFYRQPGTEKE